MRTLCLILAIFFMTVGHADVTTGNIKGHITMVEYFDYNCPICRGFAPTVNALIGQEPELKVIERVVPVLAPSSRVIDSLVLASVFQEKFDQTDRAVLAIRARETIPFPMLANTFRHLGLNLPMLTKDSQRPEIQKQLRENLMHFQALNVHQIPVIQIYASNAPDQKLQFVGSQSLATLQKAIGFIQSKQGEHYVTSTHR